MCTARYRGIQIQPKYQFEFVPRDTEKFECLDFDQLNKISPPFKISICIPTSISSLIFSGTGCTGQLSRRGTPASLITLWYYVDCVLSGVHLRQHTVSDSLFQSLTHTVSMERLCDTF